jgi:hypothetical protein
MTPNTVGAILGGLNVKDENHQHQNNELALL